MTLAEHFRNARIYDLAQPYFVGMPHYPVHPPFLYSLNKQHGDFVLPNGASSAAETITLGAHVGTHIDGLSHFTCNGKLHDGIEPVQSWSGGIEQHPIDSVAPIFRRGVLLDVAGNQGVGSLAEDFEVLPEHLDACRVELRPGDVALIRTGWAQFWNDSKRFITGGRGSAVKGPGPGLAGARWLSDRAIFAAGSDTVSFERVPSQMDVHVHLLVEKGIHIMECLNLDELAKDSVKEFLFVALPLKIRGGTGSPVRPVAVIA